MARIQTKKRTIVTVFQDFIQFLQASDAIVHRLGPGRFLPNPPGPAVFILSPSYAVTNVVQRPQQAELSARQE
jgi:hypothetical protein